MNLFYPTKFITFFSSLFVFNNQTSSSNILKENAVVYAGKTMKVTIPHCPLTQGSVKIEPLSDNTTFSEWSGENHVESYALIQKVIEIWRKNKVEAYMIYGKESNQPRSLFSWEIVPYPNSKWAFWQQLKVLWNLTFGSPCLSKVEKERVLKVFEKESFSTPQIEQAKAVQKAVQSNDPFCQSAVIQKQLVFEGKEVYLLYNYAPIVMDDKLHFLVVPKQHRSTFSELTESEYLESRQLLQKLTLYYKSKNYQTAYLFDKNGKIAGQTVPHWHEHVVFTASKAQELLGRLKIFKNMLIGSSPLPQKELQTRVQALKAELKPVLDH